jgi:hypothetical protein
MNKLLVTIITGFTIVSFAYGKPFEPPHVGETEAQVRAIYHDPDSISFDSSGQEVWTYVLGKGQMFIPIYGAFAKYRSLIVIFNRRGRVTQWSTESQ